MRTLPDSKIHPPVQAIHAKCIPPPDTRCFWIESAPRSACPRASRRCIANADHANRIRHHSSPDSRFDSASLFGVVENRVIPETTGTNSPDHGRVVYHPSRDACAVGTHGHNLRGASNIGTEFNRTSRGSRSWGRPVNMVFEPLLPHAKRPRSSPSRCGAHRESDPLRLARLTAGNPMRFQRINSSAGRQMP